MSRKHAAAPRGRTRTSRSREASPAAATFAVPVSTFAPRPFEPRRPINAVIAPCPGGYTASFLDADLATSGDSEAEALDNLKDLLLLVFEDFEKADDATLGPAMLKQKSVLRDVIARRA